jgi:multidrug efflux pump subunit AcrA (membrane-fusion protein)
MKKINSAFNWKLAAIAVGVLALAGGGYWWYTQKQASSDVQYRTSKIERGSLQASVSASGAVNPVTQVSVGTQVSGQIKELYVDFNSEVKAGQLIALIDPETFEYCPSGFGFQPRTGVDGAGQCGVQQRPVVTRQA